MSNMLRSLRRGILRAQMERAGARGVASARGGRSRTGMPRPSLFASKFHEMDGTPGWFEKAYAKMRRGPHKARPTAPAKRAAPDPLKKSLLLQRLFGKKA